MKGCALVSALCGLAVSAMVLPSAKGQDKAVAEKAAAPGEQLRKSLETWQELKDKCGGNYSYTVGSQSWAGFGHTTEIVVRGNKVTERKYGEFNRNAPPPPPEPGKEPKLPGENWIEKGDQLGSHKKGAPLKTLDDLYAEAKEVVEKKLSPEQRLYLTFDKQGLLQSCFYVDTRIADDAPRTGVAIGNIRLEPASSLPGPKSSQTPAPGDTAKSAGATPAPKVQPVKEISKLTPKGNAFKPGRPPQPTVLRSEKEAGEYFSDDELAKLRKVVDFAQQIVLLFAWRGSGQDKLTFTVAESYPEQVTFNYKAGRTRDLRTHVHAYALRSNVKWNVAGAASKPVKPAEGDVSWDELRGLVRKGEVQSVMQTHSRRVTVIMADGKKYQATEPGIDDIIKFLREIGKDVPIATE